MARHTQCLSISLISWEIQKLGKDHTLVTPLSTNLMLLKIIKPTKTKLICRVTAARFSYWTPVPSCDENRWVHRKRSKSVRRSGYVEEKEDRLVGRKITLYMDFTMPWVSNISYKGKAHTYANDSDDTVHCEKLAKRIEYHSLKCFRELFCIVSFAQCFKIAAHLIFKCFQTFQLLCHWDGRK